MVKFVTLLAFTVLLGECQGFLPLNRVEYADLKLANSPNLLSTTSEPVNNVSPRFSTALRTTPSSDIEESTFINKSNIPFAIVWVLLVLYTICVAPGEFQGSAVDTGIIQSILENPQKPDVNELFLFVFNQFAVVPIAIACLAQPQASSKGPPAFPFLISANFLGYFLLGPYMFLRGEPKSSTTINELDWFTVNILENKIINGLCLALSVYFATQVPWSDLDSLIQGYSELASTSKLVSVSSVDLAILTTIAASLVPQDYRLRKPKSSIGNLLGLATLLTPVYGPLLYCFLRPSLPKD
jgi:hypothetical protein